MECTANRQHQRAFGAGSFHKFAGFFNTWHRTGNHQLAGAVIICRHYHFVLNGSKAFITNAGVAEVAVVMAVTDPARGNKGISAFVLDKGMPGFSAGRPYRKLGLHASNTAELIFDNVAVPAGQLLGELGMGFVNTMQVLEGGRVAMAAMAVGIAQAALDTALAYMK